MSGNISDLSKEARKIYDILKQSGYQIELEKKFQDLQGYKNQLLRYDFCLYNNDGSIKCLVEYDSQIHFKYIPKFHKMKQNFQAAQERDRRKNSYCLANKIPLYRVPYYKLNSINTINDIFVDEFLVKTKWHNDLINPY